MKTFSTSGTGNQQTLSEIESNKIPIYDSLADVEADLANLEEGQLVATPDTGDELSQPVDVVEEGNLHAVSSNAVAESLSYSTTEQKTGGVWIDGKPIYRKVVDIGTQTALNQDIVKNIADMNVDTTISIKAFSTQNGDCRTIPFHDSSTQFTSIRFRSADVRFISAGLNYLVVGIKAILEYTKTTD